MKLHFSFLFSYFIAFPAYEGKCTWGSGFANSQTSALNVLKMISAHISWHWKIHTEKKSKDFLMSKKLIKKNRTEGPAPFTMQRSYFLSRPVIISHPSNQRCCPCKSRLWSVHMILMICIWRTAILSATIRMEWLCHVVLHVAWSLSLFFPRYFRRCWYEWLKSEWQAALINVPLSTTQESGGHLLLQLSLGYWQKFLYTRACTHTFTLIKLCTQRLERFW